MKHKLLLSSLLVLNFCAYAQKKKSIYVDTSSTGVIVGTISLENMRRITTKYSFFYFNDSIKALLINPSKKYSKRKIRQKYGVELDVSYRGRDFVIDEKCYYIFKIEKPVGEYNFYEIELFRNTGYMNSTWILPITQSFTIEKNRVKYIGELNLKEKDDEFNLLNNFKTDSAQIAKKYPELDLSNAQ